jgi:hypothetical protein
MAPPSTILNEFLSSLASGIGIVLGVSITCYILKKIEGEKKGDNEPALGVSGGPVTKKEDVITE